MNDLDTTSKFLPNKRHRVLSTLECRTFWKPRPVTAIWNQVPSTLFKTLRYKKKK